MAYNKSKAKGSAYEQKIANLLSKEFDVEFRRVPRSEEHTSELQSH